MRVEIDCSRYVYAAFAAAAVNAISPQGARRLESCVLRLNGVDGFDTGISGHTAAAFARTGGRLGGLGWGEPVHWDRRAIRRIQ